MSLFGGYTFLGLLKRESKGNHPFYKLRTTSKSGWSPTLWVPKTNQKGICSKKTPKRWCQNLWTTFLDLQRRRIKSLYEKGPRSTPPQIFLTWVLFLVNALSGHLEMKPLRTHLMRSEDGHMLRTGTDTWVWLKNRCPK